MIPDQLQFSQLSFCLPAKHSFNDSNMKMHEEDMSGSQSMKQTFPSSNISSNLSCPTVDTSQLSYSDESSDSEKFNSQSNSNSKRKFFTKEEDRLLTIAAMTFRQGCWNSIAQHVPGKTPKQCRDRWTNYLQPFLKFEPWTNQEDQLLVSLVNDKGTHWTKMKSYFPNRSTNSIKNRWYWLIKNQVKVIPASKLNNHFSNQIPYQPLSNYSLGENNYYGINSNGIFNNNINMINNNTNNSQIDFQQKNNQKYYLMKNRVKRKNSIRSSKKQNNLNKNMHSNFSSTYSQPNNNNNLQSKKQNFAKDELISFNPEELDW